jgi:hypothetical protein
MVAEELSGRNGDGVERSARGGADGAHDVRLPTAHPAHDRKHGETVARRQAGKDLARLLETDADLQRKTRGAQPSIVAREHRTKTAGNGVRTIGGAETGRAEAIEAALVESLIGEAPGDRLTGPQLLATDRAGLATNPRLHIGKRSRSASRRSHGQVMSNDGASSRVRDYAREVPGILLALSGQQWLKTARRGRPTDGSGCSPVLGTSAVR